MLLRTNITSLYTLLKIEITRVLRIWPQSILPSIITSTLYYLIFGKFMGTRIGTMQEIDYILFISPGLIMMSLIVNSYTNVTISFYMARFTRSIEEILVSPTLNITMLLGYILGGVFRGLLVAFLVLSISWLFVSYTIYSISLTIFVAFISSLLMSIMGLLNGIFAKSFDDTSIVSTFILTPLIYLGGIFFSSDLLSAPWNKIAILNPILHIVNSFRFALIGIADINVITAITVICILCILLFLITLQLLNRGYGIKN